MSIFLNYQLNVTLRTHYILQLNYLLTITELRYGNVGGKFG